MSSALAAAPPIQCEPPRTSIESILRSNSGNPETFPVEYHLKLESVTLKES
jgi:hypothetical protein